MKFRWTIAPAQPLLVEQLAARAKVSRLLSQCLVNRGYTEPAAIDRFLAPRLKNLSDPGRLPNMAAAIDRLYLARDRQEPIVIFGDYDVDGVTSTTLLLEVFRRLGWQVDAYLPHRMDEGYGLSRDGVENCLAKFPVKLLLAVDCGSTAVESIRWLRERGVDVIVLDHHQVSAPAPSANALVNPQLNQEFTELCSVGLAFKLAHALVKRGREIGLPGAAEFDLRPLLDLVALGTIADLVPLTGENRILVSSGLEKLGATSRPGIVALKEVAASPEKLGVYDVGFQLAPRLNAAGRLESAAEALNLLLAPDQKTALPLAQNLDARNRERQSIERSMADEVIGRVRAKFDPKEHFVIVEGQLLWHIGVVGIVASRVLSEFYRPTIIIGGEGGEWRGSGRSISGFDLAAGLRACDDLLLRHGGHAMAAGLSIVPDKIDALRERLNHLARTTIKADDFKPPLRLDAEARLSECGLGLLRELESLEPTGQGNPAVQLFARNLKQSRPAVRMGTEKQHVKMWVTDGSATVETVWWNAGKSPLPDSPFDLAFAPQINDFNGQLSIQLKLLDWRPAA